MPASTERLLADVLAHPEDDAPRLVYADALQTAGDPRGELIAVQCELARLGCHRDEQLFREWIGDDLAEESALADGRIAQLRRRESALLKEHGKRWAGELLSGARRDSARMWRGFIQHVLWDHGSRAAEDFEALMSRAPVDSMLPRTTSAKALRGLFELPAFARIAEIYNAYVHELGLLPFAESALPGLRRLLLAHAGGPHELIALAKADWLPRLTGLVLSGFSLAESDVAGLCSKASRLEELQLVDTRLGAAATAAIAKVPRIDRLRVLAVRHGRLGPSDAAPLLRHAKLASSLMALDLRTNKLGRADTEILGAGFPSLRVLALGNNPLDEDAIRGLVGGRGLLQLRTLSLEKANVNDTMFDAIVRSRRMSQLRTLDLRKNALTDRAVGSLLRVKELTTLRALYLSGNELTPSGKKRLKEAPSLRNVRLYL